MEAKLKRHQNGSSRHGHHTAEAPPHEHSRAYTLVTSHPMGGIMFILGTAALAIGLVLLFENKGWKARFAGIIGG